MTTISLELPDELAQRLVPYQDRLPEIIELGLRQLDVDIDSVPPTPRQYVEQILASSGLVVLPKPDTSQRHHDPKLRQTPIKAGGKPASEIIIQQQRGKL